MSIYWRHRREWKESGLDLPVSGALLVVADHAVLPFAPGATAEGLLGVHLTVDGEL